MSINKKKKDDKKSSDNNNDEPVAPVVEDPGKELTYKQKQKEREKLETELMEDPDGWDEVELEAMARKAAQGRYLALQNSSYMGEISRRIILGQDTRAIAAWLITTAPHEFPDVQVSSLVIQLNNFKKELLEEVYENGADKMKDGKIPDISPIDMEVIRFKDRAMVVQGMMERAVLFQEARLIKAMSLETALNAQGEQVISDQVAAELDRYWSFLERLGRYKKMIGREDDGDSAVRELTHNFQQMQKIYDLMPARSKEEFREQIESLARQRAVQEREMKKSEEGSQ